MKIDGKAIAQSILKGLRISNTPTLAVIQVGDDPASNAYIRQKQKAAEQIGAKIIHRRERSTINNTQLQTIIEKFNSDPFVHGIIVQRPLPEGLRADGILPSKDVDGFLPNSPYPVPVAEAVLTILEQVTGPGPVKKQGQAPSIVILGRGETAGKPIADLLIKNGYKVTVIHSQTKNPNEIIEGADIVVSCVGKLNVVRRDNIKTGAVLISVGISRNSDGTLHGDYEEEEIKDVASFYTPTPGGVGPVNVACLTKNLIQATSKLL